jgi:hypothetical protein
MENFILIMDVFILVNFQMEKLKDKELYFNLMVLLCMVNLFKVKSKKELLIAKNIHTMDNLKKIYFMAKDNSEANYIIINLLECFNKVKK